MDNGKTGHEAKVIVTLLICGTIVIVAVFATITLASIFAPTAC